MQSYCEYFTEWRSLAECNTTKTVSPFITTKHTELSSRTLPLNNATVLTHVFPNETVFALTAKHPTTETALPPAATMLAQSATLNVKVPFNAPEPWSFIGLVNTTRIGPYWLTQPIRNESRPEGTYKSLGSTIVKHFALTRRPPKWLTTFLIYPYS